MMTHLAPPHGRVGTAGFSLAEVLVSLLALGLIVGGLVLGYVKINYMAQWSAMSLAAQSYASQGLEQARSAQWDYVRWPNTNYGVGTSDQLGFPPSVGFTSLPPKVATMDIPATGADVFVTNYVVIRNVFTFLNPSNPPLREIRSDCIWQFPLTQKLFTNTVISLRAPDQ